MSPGTTRPRDRFSFASLLGAASGMSALPELLMRPDIDNYITGLSTQIRGRRFRLVRVCKLLSGARDQIFRPACVAHSADPVICWQQPHQGRSDDTTSPRALDPCSDSRA